MASSFKLATLDGSTQSQNTFANVYTVPSATTSMVLGLGCANLLTDTIFVDIKIINNDGDDVFYVKDAPIPPGSTLEIMSGNRIALNTGDGISVRSNWDNSFNVTLTVLEQS
jgi:hypothetical protein